MQNLNHPWSAKDDAKLVKLRAGGVDYRKISALLGRSNDACRTRFKMLRRHAVNELGEALAEEVEKDIVEEDTDSVQNAILNSVNNIFTEEEDTEVARPESKSWSQEDLETLYELRKSNVPYNLISVELKRSSESCQSKYSTTDWASLGFVTEEDQWDEDEFAVRKAVFRERILRAADRRHDNHKIGLDLLGDRLERAIRSLPNIVPTRWNPNRPKAASKEEDVVCMLSDIHIGAEHSLEETGGISYYNFERMSSRILNLQYGVRDIVELHSHMYRLPNMHVACLGDIVAGDNSSGEWSQNYISMPIVEQVISGYAKIRDMLAYWLTIFDNITFYGVRGNHGRCLSHRTQILTPQGFKKHNEVKKGDLVGTINTKTGQFEFQPIKKISIYENEKHIAKIRHRSLDMDITLDHNILHQKLTGEFSFIKPKDINLSSKYRYVIPTSVPSGKKEYPISDEWLHLLGWIMTDGCYDYRANTIYIYQSKLDRQEEIRVLLKTMGIVFTEYTRHREGQIITSVAVKTAMIENRFTILSSYWTKQIRELLPERESVPTWMYNLSDRQVGIMLESVFAGDGVTRPRRLCSHGYYAKGGLDVIWGKRHHLEQMAGLLCSHNIPCSIREHKRKQKRILAKGKEQGKNYYLQICKLQSNITGQNIKVEEYNDLAWCVSVDNGTLAVLSEDGKPYFTGNTGKRGVEKDYSNYDYLCYKFLEESFRNNPRIKFVVPKTWWILAEIRNHKILMVHGDDIGNGTPPIKKLSDFQSKMGDIVGEKPKYTLAGHFHNTAELGTNSGSVMINGSFVGGDIFSLKNVHANSRPEQTIFGMNNSRGKTWKYNIDLDDTREPG